MNVNCPHGRQRYTRGGSVRYDARGSGFSHWFRYLPLCTRAQERVAAVGRSIATSSGCSGRRASLRRRSRQASRSARLISLNAPTRARQPKPLLRWRVNRLRAVRKASHHPNHSGTISRRSRISKCAWLSPVAPVEYFKAARQLSTTRSSSASTAKASDSRTSAKQGYCPRTQTRSAGELKLHGPCSALLRCQHGNRCVDQVFYPAGAETVRLDRKHHRPAVAHRADLIGK